MMFFRKVDRAVRVEAGGARAGTHSIGPFFYKRMPPRMITRWGLFLGWTPLLERKSLFELAFVILRLFIV